MRLPRHRSALHGPWPLLVGLVLGVALVAPVSAQDASDLDALMASLLQPEDLPAGFTTLGPEEGSQFDIDSAAFTRAGGRRVVSQTWSSETSGVVFDFRMELPSPEAAAAYLDEAEATLSEAEETGLSLETDEAAIGEDARHYAGVTRVGDAAITFDNHLFHVGPVAAKVFVASVDLPDGEARRLAETAATRMQVFATPEVEPGAFEAQTPVPSAGSPSPSPALSGTLAALVPESLVESCKAFDSGTRGEIEALSCSSGDDLIVYSALIDAAALAEAFEIVTADMPEDGDAASCAAGPHVGPFVAGEARGVVACWEPPGGGLVLFWTDDSRLVLGGILFETDDHADLVAAWRAALLP
jgi:hypothetical protein